MGKSKESSPKKLSLYIDGQKKLAEELPVAASNHAINRSIDEYFRSLTIFFVLADDKISEEEVALTGDILGESHTKSSLINLVNQEYSKSLKTLTEPPLFFRAFAEQDLSGSTEYTKKSLFGIKAFILGIISADSVVSNAEETEMSLILSNLKRFLSESGVHIDLDDLTQPDSFDDLYSESEIGSANDEVNKLESLVGLEDVKREVSALMNLIKVGNLRASRGIKTPPLSMHLVFTGNPGTGKTTVARIFGKILKELNILSSGHLIESDRSGLVAGYVGQTAIKTKEVIDKSMGGILFIDEAYTLSGSSDNDYGQEAIDTLLKAMEDKREDFVVIVAGYTDEMKGFIKSNPGLSSRFNKYIEYSDYDVQELSQIMHVLCNSNGYTYGEGFEQAILDVWTKIHENKDKDFGNGRAVRNIFEKLIQAQSNRVVLIDEPTDSDLSTFIPADIDSANL